jgi:hypothetical protein
MSKIKDWLKPDKSLHIILSAILVVFFFGFTKSLVLSVLITVGIGLIKEFVFDGLLKMGVKNTQDIWADLIGTVIGLASLLYLLATRSI